MVLSFEQLSKLFLIWVVVLVTTSCSKLVDDKDNPEDSTATDADTDSDTDTDTDTDSDADADTDTDTDSDADADTDTDTDSDADTDTDTDTDSDADADTDTDTDSDTDARPLSTVTPVSGGGSVSSPNYNARITIGATGSAGSRESNAYHLQMGAGVLGKKVNN